MRATPHLLLNVEKELQRCPSKIGAAFLAEYRTAIDWLDRQMKKDEPDYSFNWMDRIHKCAERLQQWYDSKVKEHEETARRKNDR